MKKEEDTFKIFSEIFNDFWADKIQEINGDGESDYSKTDDSESDDIESDDSEYEDDKDKRLGWGKTEIGLSAFVKFSFYSTYLALQLPSKQIIFQ